MLTGVSLRWGLRSQRTIFYCLQFLFNTKYLLLCPDICKTISSFLRLWTPVTWLLDPGSQHNNNTSLCPNSFYCTYLVISYFITKTHVKQKISAAASHLPAEISVVHVTHKQRLCGEGVRLDVHIGSGHLTKTTSKQLQRVHKNLK